MIATILSKAFLKIKSIIRHDLELNAFNDYNQMVFKLGKLMPEVRVNLSQQTIDLLEELKKEHGLKTRSQALEMIIEQLLTVPEDTNPEPEG